MEKSRAHQASTLLETAHTRLVDAHGWLTDDPPRYAQAASALVEVIDAGLDALLVWHGSYGIDGAPRPSRAERAVSLASILRTPLRRARRLVPVAERLQGGDASLPIGDREAVLEGFYATRNLYFTLRGALPPAVRPDSTLPPDASVPVADRGREAPVG